MSANDTQVVEAVIVGAGMAGLTLAHALAGAGIEVAVIDRADPSTFTDAASTSFANPAVTIARGFTDSFSGITPTHVLPFVLAQLVGAGLAVPLASWLFRRSPSSAAG